MTSSLDRHAHDHDFLEQVAQWCERDDTQGHPDWAGRLRTIAGRVPQPVTADMPEPGVGAIVVASGHLAVRCRDGWFLLSIDGGPQVTDAAQEQDAEDYWPGLRDHFVKVGAALLPFGAS